MKPDNTIKLVIGIATAGRREVLSQTIRFIASQTRLPDEFILCPASENDMDAELLSSFPGKTKILHSPKGSCAQRNAILSYATDSDVIVIFDDDFLPHPTFLAETERLFVEMPDVIIATGKVLADGIGGPGLTFEEGMRIINNASPPPFSALHAPQPVHNAYGCNMIFRLAPIHAHAMRFDEALPLYGWLEDVDFCRRLAPYGRIVQSDRILGVHLGTKVGRTPGVRLGYSQIANPIYMARKKSLAWRRALSQIGRNLAANTARSLAPEHWIDRRGRLRGNCIAILDLLRGELAPRRILDFK